MASALFVKSYTPSRDDRLFTALEMAAYNDSNRLVRFRASIALIDTMPSVVSESRSYDYGKLGMNLVGAVEADPTTDTTVAEYTEKLDENMSRLMSS